MHMQAHIALKIAKGNLAVVESTTKSEMATAVKLAETSAEPTGDVIHELS